MPQPGVALEKLGFLTIGLFDGQDPGPGHQVTLEMTELGERLEFDGAWVRRRHLQYGISSPVAVLAAASQRTSRIERGTAVIPRYQARPGPRLGARGLAAGEVDVATAARRPSHAIARDAGDA